MVREALARSLLCLGPSAGGMRGDPIEWLEERYHDVGLPAPWEVPRRLREAVERVRDRIEDLLEEPGEDPDDDSSHDPPPPPEETSDGWDWRDINDIALVLHVIDRVLDLGVEVDHELTRDVATRWMTIQDDASVIDVWFSRRTVFVTPVAWAARVGDPMLHGGFAGPGPGSENVTIGGRPALRAGDQALCPLATPCLHGPAPLVSTNTSVWINDRPAIRVGDFVVDAGGNNPIIVGCPTVTVGAPPAPVDASVPTEHLPGSRTITRRRLETRERVRVALGLTVGDVLFGGLRSAWTAASAEIEIESRTLGVEVTEHVEIVGAGEARSIDVPGWGRVAVQPYVAVVSEVRRERTLQGVRWKLGGLPSFPGHSQLVVSTPRIETRWLVE